MNLRCGLNYTFSMLLNPQINLLNTRLNFGSLQGGRTLISLKAVFWIKHFSRKLPFGLIIALDESGNAQGSMYLDDGDQLLGKFNFYNDSFFEFLLGKKFS